ncbi:acetyl/propionyl/methylcrotonyl-CoA carboxylase subunit alpha [Quadrisphaera sp. DSM 44207]|uniref:acetyl-CoA carboxylase biotin carboxylase subunit n=1 Tax=Quadrisphaera sp. DSM 44207 TaxID=1881057 RepID=UPI00088E4CC0|nr:acetyl-CoA carboxylase biotin carboxylase subunit [Quadrisphaera sp. DSM 44207]SDQ09893.1 acetyl-CoA carboxylase, biotin carboxylase subunit [Quadrisphaera sp. DSM 44207]
MFSKVLIANRGEIAVRIARACRELGIEVVAVHSTADRDAPFVRLADEAVQIGPGPSRHSYLNIPNIIEAARQTGAEAIHPGYGFLSEDPDFAEVCADAGIVFIGPRPEVMSRLGNKATARSLMAAAGLPLLPGAVDPVPTVEEGAALADEIGYPVVVKAVAGGGGRGITVVRDAASFAEAYTSTRRTAHAVFRDSSVYVERYLERARHVEVQVLVDNYGNGVHLGERDCSVQRRHQKLIEEAPATSLDPDQRAALGAVALEGALAVDYTGAGTFEFIVDPQGRAAFMEVNTRIQVEHPVTEVVTGVDLVREQIRIAAGEPLGVKQEDVVVTGAAIECRINAEDPRRAFAPTAGLLDVVELPGGPGVRVDAGYTAGSRVTPHYDSLLAKVVVWAPDREQALTRMQRALAELRIEGRGVATTRELHQALLRSEVFRAGEHHTGFLDQHLPELTA